MTRRLAAFALAAAAVAGVATAVFPQHAWSIVRIAAVAVAALAGAVVLAAVGALASDEGEPTALDRTPSRQPTPLDPHGLRDARRDLERARHAGTVSKPVWDRLRVAATAALIESGLDIENRATRPIARRMLSRDTWTLLSTPPQPGGTVDPAATARIVNRTLDEFEKLPTGARP